MIKTITLSLILLIGPAHADSSRSDLQFLGKSELGDFYTKYSEVCCMSGRSNKSAELVVYSTKNPGVRISKLLRDGDIDGEQGDFKYQSLFYKNKIFLLTISNFFNNVTYEGSFWKWDAGTNQFVELIPGKNEISLEVNSEKSPSKVYSPLDELIEAGRIEEAWLKATELRANAYPDAFRTTSINYESNSGHSLHMALFSKLRDHALRALTSGEKKEAGLRVCRAMKLPDPVSYVDGSESSDPCAIAKLKVELNLEPEDEGFEDIAITGDSTPVPKACLIQANDFNIARTKEAITTMNDLGFILDEAGFHKEAVSILKAVVKASPNRAVAYLNLADAYGHLGETKKAQAEYKKYLAKLGPKSQAQAAPRTDWIKSPSSEDCPSISKLQKLVLSKKPSKQREKQVQKALDDFFNSGGNLNAFVIGEIGGIMARHAPLVHFLASQGDYRLMEELVRSGKTAHGLDEALRDALYDRDQEAKTVKLLEDHDAKYIPSEMIRFYFSSDPLFQRAKGFLTKHRNYILDQHFDEVVTTYDTYFSFQVTRKSLSWPDYLKGSALTKPQSTRFLFEAIKKDHLDLAKLLLQMGAEVNGFNDEGQTPLDLAMSIATSKAKSNTTTTAIPNTTKTALATPDATSSKTPDATPDAMKTLLTDHGAKRADQLGELILLPNSNQRRIFESLPPKIRSRVSADLGLPFK